MVSGVTAGLTGGGEYPCVALPARRGNAYEGSAVSATPPRGTGFGGWSPPEEKSIG
jgi:hypothetical protein